MTPMLLNWIFVSAGFVLLYVGAEGLVRGSVKLSSRLGITPLVIGLTVVAFGTSAPELFVSIKANLGGSGDIAIGNIVGSNIFNLAIILGMTALLRPIKVESQLVKQDIPIMIAATVLFFVVARNLTLNRIEGSILFLLLIAYIVITIRMARHGSEEKLTEEFKHHLPKPSGNILVDLVFVVIGIGLLVFGSSLLVEGAVNIAEAAGVSQAIIGLTLIAAGTGLPELATALVAAAKKETDLAVGNVVGSNIFNMLCIGGISPLVKPIIAPDIQPVDLYVMIGLSILILPMGLTGGKHPKEKGLFSGGKLARKEGLLLLACYGGYMVYLWPN